MTLADGILFVLGLIADGATLHTCHIDYEDSAMNTEQLIDDIIRREGGYVNHPADPGGATNFGITQRSWNAWRAKHSDLLRPTFVRDIDKEHAREFYRDEYIEPNSWIEDDALLALYVDSAINHGPHRVKFWLQTAAGVKVDGIIGPVTRATVNSKSATTYRELLKRRFKFYAKIASDQLHEPGGDPQAVFLRGWINRACEFIV